MTLMKISFQIIAGLVIAIGIMLFTPTLNGSENGTTENKKNIESNVNNKAVARGIIVDEQGKGLSGVRVLCWRLGGPFICEIDTDSTGQYQFTLPVNQTYELHVGGLTSTNATSKEFTLKPDETHNVENIKVRPATSSCNGRIVFENGQPAANLVYGHVSGNFASDSAEPLKTNNKGEFEINHLLPDELFSLWIFPKENTLYVWKRLDPNTNQQITLTLKADEYIELPLDWAECNTHTAIARNMTFAKDSKIQFNLPDLYGNKISLRDQRFKNKAVLVNICGSWCGSCRLEIPYLVEFKNKYQKEGLEIIGIAFERGSKEEQLQAVKKIAQEFKVNYPLLIGGTKDNKTIGTVINGLELFLGYPTTLYIGPDGLVKHIQVGFWLEPEHHKLWQIRQMDNHIKSILTMTSN